VSQKVYKMVNGVLHTGTAPDGTHLEIYATIFRGKDLPPIEAIDYDNGVYRREGGDWQDIPAEHFYNADIVWDDAVGQG